MRKRIIITGATSGIGLETLKKLANKDYEIIIGCRNEIKAKHVVAEILKSSPEAKIHSYKLNLASFDSIQRFSKHINDSFDYIDILFNNAGLFLDKEEKTKQGFQMTIGVNYIGTYYLTYLLTDIVSRGHHPQIIHNNSRAALFGHLTYKEGRFANHPKGFRAYAASKYMQLMWIYYTAEEFMDKGIRVNGIHPGDVATNIWSMKNSLINLIWPFLKRTLITQEEGALAGLYLIKNDKLKAYGNLYQNEGEIMNFPKYDVDQAKRLVEITNAEIRKLGYRI